MVILKTKDPIDPLLIREAVRVLKKGGVIVFPTETSYGLGCDPRNVKAVNRIYSIKYRPRVKFFLLVAGTVAQVARVARLNATAKALVKKYWPGPLTLVLPTRHQTPLSNIVAPRRTVRIRVSASVFVHTLTKAYGFPIIATSANRSGQPDCYSGRAVIRAFALQKNQPDLVIDAGSLPRRKPSTIVRVDEEGEVEVIRQGGLKIKVTSP